MKSMTGHGRSEHSQHGCKFSVEITSFNHKQSDLFLKLPVELEALEGRIRDVVHAKLSRGRVTLVVTLHRSNRSGEGQVELNEHLALAYLRAIRKLQRKTKLNGSVTLETILRAPGVLKLAESTGDAEALWPGVEAALHKALAQLITMREKEGRHLAADLNARLRLLERGIATIRQVAPLALERFRKRLRARIAAAGLNLRPDDDRLVKEVIFFADRCDISEELTRLDSHCQQFRDSLKSREPVGRTLDFLAQEMNREINTIGSKANDAAISQEVVKLKAELEKIREQVQNIE